MTSSAFPSNLEAERTVLGELLRDHTGRAALELQDQLAPEDFYRTPHGRLFGLLVRHAAAGEPLDLLRLAELLRHGEAGRYGGLNYVLGLPDQVGVTENLGAYARLIRDRARRRDVIRAAHQLVAGAQDPSAPLAEALEVFAAAAAVAQPDPEADAPLLGDLALSEIDRRREAPAGVPLPWRNLSARLRPPEPGHLVVVAGRPGMGKSAFSLQWATEAALSGWPVLYLSLEMPRAELALRCVARLSGVPLGRLFDGAVTVHEVPHVQAAADRLNAAPLHIQAVGSVPIETLLGRIRALKAREPGLSLVVVDYVQLVAGDARVSRERIVSDASRELKGAAMQLGVSLVAVAQLNRGCEQRSNKRPLMSDLAHSGQIENDADKILLLYRDDYYHQKSADAGLCEVSFPKSRQGATGVEKLAWDGPLQRFSELERRVA